MEKKNCVSRQSSKRRRSGRPVKTHGPCPQILQLRPIPLYKLKWTDWDPTAPIKVIPLVLRVKKSQSSVHLYVSETVRPNTVMLAQSRGIHFKPFLHGQKYAGKSETHTHSLHMSKLYSQTKIDHFKREYRQPRLTRTSHSLRPWVESRDHHHRPLHHHLRSCRFLDGA